MKTKLLIFTFLFTTSLAMSQVVANQVDDFEDGTVQDWVIGTGGTTPPNPPTNIPNGGPNGAGDNFLQYATTGSPGGPGSKVVIINEAGNWDGNYTSEGVIAIKMDVEVLENDLEIRVAFDGDGGIFCTTNGIAIPANSGWTSITIPISASDFTAVGGSDINATLAGVTIMRVLSRTSVGWIGDALDATLNLDNITASTTLSVDDFNKKPAFTIYPNPSASKLAIAMADFTNDVKIEVFNILGKKVYNGVLNTIKSNINVSQWQSGVYLVRLTTDDATITKRFIKQ